MQTIIKEAAFLSCEKKSFGKGDQIVSFGEIKILDTNNEVIKATMNIEKYNELEVEGFPYRLETIDVELDVTEEEGKNGQYLKKKFLEIL